MSLNEVKKPQLVQDIEAALAGLEKKSLTIHVSVARESKWEDRPTGDKVLVRWLCWSIEDEEVEVFPPTFAVLSDSITQERLATELPVFFHPPHWVRVDDDIEE